MSDTPLSVDAYRARVLDAIEPAAVVDCPLEEAQGLVLASDLTAPVALPGFDNSAMDGYAVVAADLVGASADSPVTLPVIGAIGAGQLGPSSVSSGSVAKIMTGAPMPAGADAVVPYEWTDRGGSSVVISQAPEVGAHVRPAGDDVRRGDLLLTAGRVLGARQVGLLASVGFATVPARPRPRVAVISTGSELRELGTPLDEGAIHDSNSYLLAACVRAAGAEPVRIGRVSDSAPDFLATLRGRLADVDAVVTSGGVSQGDYDVVKAALSPLGTVWFGPIAMQPGKPQGFGRVDGVPIFTLPGNPVSSYLSFEMFVHPALRRMMGHPSVVRPEVAARITTPWRSMQGRRQLVRATYSDGSAPTVTPVGGSGSHLIGDLAHADSLIVVGEDVTSLAAGDEVAVIRLDQPF